MNQPLVIDAKNVIIVGHTRYRALMELEVPEVPVIVADIPAKLAKEYRIADNKTNEMASWDMSMLIPEMRELDLAAMSMFFPDIDLTALVSDTPGGYSPVQQSQVDKVLDKTDRGILKPTLGDHIKLTCVHCGGDLIVDRSTLETHGGES